MKVLILDGHNLIHRARAGYNRGAHSITYMFFRSLRPLIEKMSPDKVYFVLEGSPKKRIQLDGDYKANRKIDESDPKWETMQDFFRQKDECVELLYQAFPFTIVRHPDFEADDIIAQMRTHRSSFIIQLKKILLRLLTMTTWSGKLFVAMLQTTCLAFLDMAIRLRKRL
jgi:5'-3' exonuclease